jgi:predicted enzyme related to lactoylglutathione lyase
MSVCLITSDVRGLCEFYAKVLEAKPEGDDFFAMFLTPELNLSISSTQLLENLVPGQAFNPVRGGSCFLEFEVEDVDQEYERLQDLNVEVLKPPTTQPWGLRSVWFSDPEGNRINFYA